MDAPEQVYVNGIDGVTGEYLLEPATPTRMAAQIKDEHLDSSTVRWLRHIWRALSQPHRGLPPEVDPTDLRRAGWAIVFHSDEDPAVRAALAPLIEHRRRQIGNDRLVKVLQHWSGESPRAWLERQRASLTSVEPARVPYYVLLVGSPTRIPFSFGQMLVEYAVGRLDFAMPQEYANYVASLLAIERQEAPPTACEATFFATRHPCDMVTQTSADWLATPLVNELQDSSEDRAAPALVVRQFIADRATKAQLAGLIAPDASQSSPSLLFTATHGVGWPRGSAQQRTDQGALICQDWPGFGAIKAEHYFAGHDISPNANVHGMIALSYACYSAGMPSHDRFACCRDEPPPQIADEPFVAALPQALLSHPAGGAQAWIGHVERTWTCAMVGRAGQQISPFRNTIRRLLAGQPVGHAMKDFRERYAALSTELSDTLEQIRADPFSISDEELVRRWIERNEAEGYVVIGDPAAHLWIDNCSVR